MLPPSTQRAPLSVVINPNERGRPIVTSGPVRTVLTDTGQIIRAGAVFNIGSGTGTPVFLNSQWALARSVGLNCMRVGVDSGGEALPLNTLLDRISQIAELARTNRMYLMLGYFVAPPGEWGGELPGSLAQWNLFWSQAGLLCRDMPWVFFEMVNEPTKWGQVSTYTAAVKAGLKEVYDTMRAAAPSTLIVFPSAANLAPSASQYATLMQSFDTLGNGQPIDWSNTALAYHYYNQTMALAVTGGSANATDGGEAGLRSLGATYPLLMTETNWWMEAPRDVLIDGLDLHESIGIGWTVLRRAGQTTPTSPNPFPGDLFPDPLTNKIAQLRSRGFTIPIE